MAKITSGLFTNVNY